MARKLSPKMKFFRDVQKKAKGLPFKERARLAKLAAREYARGVRSAEAVVRRFRSPTAAVRSNPAKSWWEKAALLALAGLATYLVLSGKVAIAAAPATPAVGNCSVCPK